VSVFAASLGVINNIYRTVISKKEEWSSQFRFIAHIHVKFTVMLSRERPKIMHVHFHLHVVLSTVGIVCLIVFCATSVDSLTVCWTVIFFFFFIIIRSRQSKKYTHQIHNHSKKRKTNTHTA